MTKLKVDVIESPDNVWIIIDGATSELHATEEFRKAAYDAGTVAMEPYPPVKTINGWCVVGKAWRR